MGKGYTCIGPGRSVRYGYVDNIDHTEEQEKDLMMVVVVLVNHKLPLVETRRESTSEG